MSTPISTSNPLPSRPPRPEHQPLDPATKQVWKKPAENPENRQISKHHRPDFLRQALKGLIPGGEHDDRKVSKAFNHLVKSLEKSFGEAPKLDRKTGEEEFRQGGLRRIDKDLRKLFKGLGMPPQLAKKFSRDMTEAMKNGDVEQINFSMTATRSFDLEIHQLQDAYLANGDGSLLAAGTSNSLQISAVQVRSLDFSLNLRTGEFSMSRTRTDEISISSSSSAGLLSTGPLPDGAEALPTSAEEVPGAPEPSPPAPESTNSTEDSTEPVTEPVAQPGATPTDDITALVQSNSRLLQISRTVQQSAIMQMKPIPATAPTEGSQEEDSKGGLRVLQDMIDQLDAINHTAGSLFESMVQIRNLRVERENDDDHLSFTVDALAPVGLTAVDEDGRGTTLFPRSDGTLAKTVDDPVKTTV